MVRNISFYYKLTEMNTMDLSSFAWHCGTLRLVASTPCVATRSTCPPLLWADRELFGTSVITSSNTRRSIYGGRPHSQKKITNALKLYKHKKSHTPQIIGIVDGTHIAIKKPKVNESTYVNRKSYHSINATVSFYISSLIHVKIISYIIYPII